MVLAAAMVESLIAPIAYPLAKWGTFGALTLYGLMEEQTPHVDPNWTGMGTGPGQEPYETVGGDDPPPQIAPNGGDPGGNLNYGGPDCAAADFYGKSVAGCG